MSSSADNYASAPYDPPPRHSRTNSRSSQASRHSEQLPAYPPTEQGEDSAAQGSSEQTLLEQKKEEKVFGRAAPDVDGFRFEVERVIHELVAVKADLKELAVLHDRARAVPSSTSSRCAATNKLTEDLDTLKKLISNTFTPLPPILRTLNTRAPHLRGGGGRAFVLTSETEEVKQQLAHAGKLMKECVEFIDSGVTRGARLDQAARKSSPSIPEVEACPFAFIKDAYIAEAGETGILFLDKIIAPAPTTQATSWLNPFAYSLPTWTITPPPEDAQGQEEDQSRPLLKAEEEEGPWGESTAPKETPPFSKRRLFLILGIFKFALALGGTITGMILWSQHSYVPDATTPV